MSPRALLRLGLPLIAVMVMVAAVRGRSANPLSPPEPQQASFSAADDPVDTARLLTGLRAFAAAKAEEAIEQLTRPTKVMDDWRLLILAESAHSAGDTDLTEATFDLLLDRHPGSPIRSLAILRATQIAIENEHWESALERIDFARSQTLPADKAKQIEQLAWDLGESLELPEVRLDAGRRLLIEHPLAAEESDVETVFRDASGSLDWSGMFSPSELQRRASRQTESGRPEDALETLEAVPQDQRSFDWQLLRAAALTRDHQGREALAVLAGLASSDTDRQVDIAWQRALAAREAGRVRRGRSNLPRSRREEMRALARASLAQVANRTSDKQKQLQALRLLFAQISDEEDSFEPSFAVLERLQRLDAADTTGTRYLWRLGWQAYTHRDFPVAIGYWSELEAMYPSTNSARSARYWTGRSHEALGHRDRAADIYAEILATDADDFYSRHARNRLDESARVRIEVPALPTEPWPEDPTLRRARWLSDSGFHELALYELEGREGVAERRAFCAQKALVLARSGKRRESIQSLSCAFPALGKAQQRIVPEEALRLYYPLDFRPIIERRAQEQNLSPSLVFAMIRQESAFDAEARSWAGARGLMQLMPATGREVAQRLGLRYSTSKLTDPDFSVRLGTRYFRQVLDMFGGNEVLALAGYNGGPYRIKKLWSRAGRNAELDTFVEGLSLEETRTYVKRILLFEDSYSRLWAEGS